MVPKYIGCEEKNGFETFISLKHFPNYQDKVPKHMRKTFMKVFV